MEEEKKQEVKPEEKKEKQRKIALRTVLATLTIIIVAIIIGISLRAQYLNIKEIGEEYIDIFVQNVKNSVMVTGVIFVIVYILVYISNKFIKRGLKKFFEEEKKQMPKLPNKSLCIIMALLASIIGSGMITQKFSVFANGAVFGISDPIFGTDIGYYMFILPFIESILIFAVEVFVALIIYTVIYYIVSLNTYFDGVDSETLKKNIFVKQIISILVIITFLLSIYLYISSQNILTQNMLTLEDDVGIELIGAGKTDVTIKLWGYRLLSIVIIISVIMILRNIKKSNTKKIMISVGILPAYLICLFICMTYFQFVHVRPNEFDNEKEFIGYNIKNTRTAYGINIEQQGINQYTTITLDEVKNNPEVMRNIPIVTEDVVLKSVKANQEKNYYSYGNTMLSKREINGETELVYITPREMLSDSTISYNNRTFKNTHGYSLVVNSATSFDKDGYVEYILSDFNGSEEINIKEPRIYFGLKTNSIIATNTKFGQENDYPKSETIYEENVYDGNAGLNLGFFDRLVLGIADKNFKLAFSSYINKDTKILTNRNVIERARVLLPQIVYDTNPYLVINDEGKLIWVIDGYTVSSAYPYSQSTVIEGRRKINYIRNSVKVLVDAYDGETTFYITDRTDPIIMTYRNMYPTLFVELEQNIPEDIKTQFVYPEFLYKIQSRMLNIYHDISEDVLYRTDDVWQITTKASMKNSVIAGVETEPYYTMLKTNNNNNPQFGLVLTYNTLLKKSITSYLVGTVENGTSKLSLYKFAPENNVASIVQLNAQIEQDAEISAQLGELNVLGTRLVKDMLIIPINNTLLYVQPVYQVMLNESEIPILKKVIVASGNRVAIGDSLSEAITNLFNDYAVDLEFIDVEDINALVDAIIKANNNLTDSLNSSNFEMIGKDIAKMQSLVNQLETARVNELEKQKELEKEAGKANQRLETELDINEDVNEVVNNSLI